MKKIFLLFFALSFYAWETTAQTHSNFYLSGLVPVGDFGATTNAFGIGVGGNVLFAVGDQDDTPVYFGPELTYFIYGHNSVDFGAGSGSYYRDLELTTNNNMLLGGGVLRIKPPLEGPVQLFVEGVGGLNYIYTRSVLKDDNNWSSSQNNSNVLDTNINFYDTSFYYGGGGGFLFLTGPFKILASGRYLKGSEAEYVDRPSVTINGPNPKDVSYFTKRSSIDMIQILFGISISF